MNWTNKDGITTATASGFQTIIQKKKSKSNIKEDNCEGNSDCLVHEVQDVINSPIGLQLEEELELDVELDDPIGDEDEDGDEIDTSHLEKKKKSGTDEGGVLTNILADISSMITVIEG